jgi:hypothetical protein
MPAAITAPNDAAPTSNKNNLNADQNFFDDKK